MTRFARAKGSKASNEKLPEPATSWNEMKQELLNKNQELAEKKEREAAMRKRDESYKAFLQEKEEEEEKKVQWADFPQTNKQNGKPMNGFKNGFSSIKQSNDWDDESDDETFTALKAQIDQALIKNANQQNESATIEDASDSDAPPEEVSVKTKPPEIVVKKVKKPKQMLKILADKTKPDTQSNGETAKKKVTAMKPLKPVKELSDKEKRLIEKKYERNRKQAEKKKLKRLNKSLKEQKCSNSNDNMEMKPQKPESPTETVVETRENSDAPIVSDIDKEKLQKKLERRKRQKEKRQLKRQNAAQKDPESLSEQDLKRIEKKKAKLARQSEKRKQLKAENANKDQPSKEVQPIPKPETKPPQNAKKPVKNKIENGEVKPQKKAKLRDNNEHLRRKNKPERMIINGKTVDVDYIDGFPIKKEDAERLKKLRKEMISKGLPRSEIDASLKLERRRAEKAFAREKKKVCLYTLYCNTNFQFFMTCSRYVLNAETLDTISQSVQN